MLQPKVQEIAKDLKVTSKEIIEQLAELGHNVKGPSAQLDDEQLGLVFDIFTSMYDVGDEPIVKPPRPAKKKAPKKAAEPKQKEKKEEPKAENPAEKKPEPVKEVKPEKKAEKPAEKKTPPAPPAPMKKKKEEPVAVAEELSDEDLVIKTEQTARYVDTRTSTVELETIETRERLEDMVSDNLHKMEGGRSKKKKKANRERAIKEQQSKPGRAEEGGRRA